jgi:hypothetical protein
VPRERGRGLDVEAGVSLLRVSIGSTATASATATSAVDWATLVRLGARAWVVRWTVGLAGLAVTRASRGLDTGQDVTSIEGLGLEGSLAGLVAF